MAGCHAQRAAKRPGPLLAWLAPALYLLAACLGGEAASPGPACQPAQRRPLLARILRKARKKGQEHLPHAPKLAAHLALALLRRLRLAGEAAADGNEAFRVDATVTAAPTLAPAGGGVAAAHAYDAAAQEQYAQWQAYYAQQQGHEYNPQQQAAAAAAAAGAADPAEAMLAAALAAEREKAARRGQRDGVGDIQIKEASGGAVFVSVCVCVSVSVCGRGEGGEGWRSARGRPLASLTRDGAQAFWPVPRVTTFPA